MAMQSIGVGPKETLQQKIPTVASCVQIATDGTSAAAVVDAVFQATISTTSHAPMLSDAADASSTFADYFSTLHHIVDPIAPILYPVSAACDCYQVYRNVTTPNAGLYKRVTQFALPAAHLVSICVVAGGVLASAPAVATAAGTVSLGIGSVKMGVLVFDKVVECLA